MCHSAAPCVNQEFCMRQSVLIISANEMSKYFIRRTQHTRTKSSTLLAIAYAGLRSIKNIFKNSFRQDNMFAIAIVLSILSIPRYTLPSLNLRWNQIHLNIRKKPATDKLDFARATRSELPIRSQSLGGTRLRRVNCLGIDVHGTIFKNQPTRYRDGSRKVVDWYSRHAIITVDQL